ncbi:FecR family protein [Flavobacterium branchiarum]|uniref:FecR family protein n=1 Tax=Flavobacterium branchiarum TaxID=1114870 RepID=A0ABV5FRM8_9FLAO|nr:FecR family protein [Flavobacterium branchiarum]MDN3673316.1 FecR family protein [Flavobacterium branchiarum]
MDEKKLEEELKKLWHETPIEHYKSVKETSWEKFQSKAFPSKKRTFTWRKYVAVAAVILMFFGTGIYLTNNTQQTNISFAGTIIENPTSKVKTVFLPDSSRVELAAYSKIEYATNFTNNRKIGVEGEAYFKVKKDKEHPFQVFCNETTTTVLGTSFIVKGNAKKEVVVALYEGSVQMSVNGQDRKWILKPGEKFTYNNNTVLVVNFNRFIDFDNQNINEVIAYVKSNYGYKLILPTEYNNKRVTVRINKKEDLKTIVQLISEMYNLNFETNEELNQITFQ